MFCRGAGGELRHCSRLDWEFEHAHGSSREVSAILASVQWIGIISLDGLNLPLLFRETSFEKPSAFGSRSLGLTPLCNSVEARVHRRHELHPGRPHHVHQLLHPDGIPYSPDTKYSQWSPNRGNLRVQPDNPRQTLLTLPSIQGCCFVLFPCVSFFSVLSSRCVFLCS